MSGGSRCTICDHPQREIIDGILAAGSLSRRTVANQFGLNESSVQRHKTSHLTKRIVAAVERKQAKADDVFMERHEHLYKETLQYIEDAKGAVKMQKVTTEVETGDGFKLQDRYQEFRDVGAMAPALQTAVQLQRVLGDATARFSQVPSASASIALTFVLPRSVDMRPAELPHSQVVDVQALESPSESSES